MKIFTTGHTINVLDKVANQRQFISKYKMQGCDRIGSPYLQDLTGAVLNKRLLTLSIIVFSIALYRLIPHPPNVSPVAAMALFGGVYFADKRVALIIPFAALLLSDLMIGLHDTMVFVYASFAATMMIGYWVRNRLSVVTIASAAIVSSVLFFVVTNFGSWLSHDLYPKTASGLFEAYVAGIPFFQNTLMGNLFFSAVLFGGFYQLQNKLPKLGSHSLP